MHYGDKEQLESNRLVVGIYIHEVIGTPGQTELSLSSVQHCRHVSTHLLKKFLTIPEHYLNAGHLGSEFDDIQVEKFYILELRENEHDGFQLMSYREVGDNKFENLH